MAYSKEIKKKVLNEIEEGSRVEKIIKDYRVSPMEIYTWKRQLVAEISSKRNFKEKKASKRIKGLISQGKYVEARKMGEQFPDNPVIQSQMVTVYMQEGNFEKAFKIGEKFPNSPEIQSQMITLYIRNNDYEKAKEIGKNFPEVRIIQNQLKRIDRISGAKTLSKKFTPPSEEEKNASLKINMLISQKKYEEARGIGEKFIDNPVLQSQLITICIKKGEYAEAKKIGARFKNNKMIQSQMLTIHMREGNYEEAKKIGEKFYHNGKIQSQMITIYTQEGNYEEALKIGKRLPDVPEIQSQLITIYMQLGHYNEAKEICFKFPTDEVIQSQLITMFIENGQYEKALEIGENFPDNPQIQSQIATIHMRVGEEKKVKEIADKFPDDPIIQSQMITILMGKREYSKAKRIGMKFRNNSVILSQMLSIYIKTGDLEKAKEIEEILYEADKKIDTEQVFLKSTTPMICDEEYMSEEFYEKQLEGETLNDILKKIYNTPNDATILEDIEKIEDKWLKLILNCALAEKTNMRAPAQQFIKQLKNEDYVDEGHQSTIHKLEQRLKQKGRIFDVIFYMDLIEGIQPNAHNEDGAR